jgi:hypothetical protein
MLAVPSAIPTGLCIWFVVPVISLTCKCSNNYSHVRKAIASIVGKFDNPKKEHYYPHAHAEIVLVDGSIRP